jgi:two-component system NtrC family sensor kinase
MRELTITDHSDEIRAILDAAPFPLLISRTSDGTVLYANERLADLLDLTVGELVGSKTPDLYFDPADRRLLLEKLEKEGQVTDYELRIRDFGGQERWALISVAVTKLRGESVLVSGLNEITERKEAEQALARSEEKFRSLVENANDLIYMLTPDGIFSYASPNWPEILGQEVSEIVGKSFAPLIHPDDLEACYAFLASVVETGEKQSGIEYRVRHEDGSWRWHTSNASCLKDSEGNVEWFLGIARDITEKKEAQRELERTFRELRATQAQLVQAEKMAALSSLVAGISHELNSPIGAIYSVQSTLAAAVTKLEKELSRTESDTVRAALDIILDADRVIATGAERVTEILRRLRSFARLDEAELKRADLHEGIENTLALLQNELAGRIDVVRNYGNVPPILCYPAKLNQVFLNLLTNAAHAIEGEGTITIRTFVDDDRAAVAIRDTGPGIDEKHLKSIFDPGFATKGRRVGAGLGLPICYQILQQHGGSIAAESRMGEGSVFTVRVPLKLVRT